MIRNCCGALVALLLALSPAIAADITVTVPSRNDVIAQVTKAVEFYRVHGREQALAELNRRDGAFARGMDYVDVHDLNGVCVAHPLSPEIVGQSRLGVVDLQGKLFIREIVEAAHAQPDGWITYMRENPNSGQIEHKIAYWAVYDGLIFKAGTYE
jgi:cytochrome c